MSSRVLGAIAVALVATAIVVPGMFVPLHNIAEPLEGLVVREMVATGDWVLPRRNGEEIPAKPPLYHWLTIGVARLADRPIDEVSRLAAAGATFQSLEIHGPSLEGVFLTLTGRSLRD